MKYNTVKIVPTTKRSVHGKTEPDWNVEYSKSDLDREETKTIPNARGFYHYPETMKEVDAFEVLKKEMIARHLEEIGNLVKSIQKLETLTSGS